MLWSKFLGHCTLLTTDWNNVCMCWTAQEWSWPKIACTQMAITVEAISFGSFFKSKNWTKMKYYLDNDSTSYFAANLFRLYEDTLKLKCFKCSPFLACETRKENLKGWATELISDSHSISHGFFSANDWLIQVKN